MAHYYDQPGTHANPVDAAALESRSRLSHEYVLAQAQESGNGRFAPGRPGKPDLDEAAKKISATLEKDRDFHSGLKREEIEKTLKAATADGTLNDLVSKINKQLEKDGSTLRLDATKWSEGIGYTKDVGPLMIVPEHKIVGNPRSQVDVVDTKTGERADSITSSPDIDLPGWIRGGHENPFEPKGGKSF